ncbi:conserved hypothetical protein [Hyphomicrobiales bacterium]|jgi:hypothetical protein|nr:conserved hypothetical protein [Hyphomicrobiales bacterium]CAH1702501.1 conserved hypothetical protein [Hyphomicrobiales bacterium]CAI0346702.1 conserved hypothetical protein [Hyphomicrobiales bacterium]
MIPSHVLFALVDEQVEFTVSKWNTPGHFGVLPAKDGRLKLHDGHHVMEDDATSILGQLNYLLCQEQVGRLTLTPEFEPAFDIGQIIKVTVSPKVEGRRRTGTDHTIGVRTAILASSSSLDSHQKIVYESTVNGATSIHVGGIAHETVIDMMQVSRHAMPQEIHKMIVGHRSSWTGAPDAEKSYAKLYGKAALKQAIAEQDKADNDYVSTLMGTMRP